MCLAIYKPASTRPDWDAYRNGHSANNDSWGFAALVDGQLVLRCGVGKFGEFREAFEPFADCQAIIHFRWSTHGKTDLANCHPFSVADDLAVIHNGIISIKCDVDADRSDTWHFNELVLRPMHSRDPDFFLRNDVQYSQELAHSGSKFVFLRADGTFAIWNEKAGKWDADGHWYSNDSHAYYRSRQVGYAYGGSTSRVSHSWPEEKWWQVEEDTAADSRVAVDTDDGEDDTDDEAAAYTKMRLDDLRQYGFSRKCLDEVLELLGHYGIESLHDAI